MNVVIYTFSCIEKCIDLIWRTRDDLCPIKMLLTFNVYDSMCSQGQIFTHPEDLRLILCFYTSIFQAFHKHNYQRLQ